MKTETGNQARNQARLYGPGEYAAVKADIEQHDLKPAAMADAVFQINAALDSEAEDDGSEVKEMIGQEQWHLWGFTGNLYLPKRGSKGIVYIQDNPEIRNGKPFMEESELIKKLEAGDPSVRGPVQLGYKTGEISSSELAEHPYILALVRGEPGAEELKRFADEHYDNLCLYSFDSVRQPLIRLSALYSSKFPLPQGGDGGGLAIQGYLGEYWACFGLGLQ